LIRQLLGELKKELRCRRLPVVATGGYARLMAAKLPEITAVEPLHTLEGLQLVWEAHAAGKAGQIELKMGKRQAGRLMRRPGRSRSPEY
jgi:hypothetical protein